MTDDQPPRPGAIIRINGVDYIVAGWSVTMTPDAVRDAHGVGEPWHGQALDAVADALDDLLAAAGVDPHPPARAPWDPDGAHLAISDVARSIPGTTARRAQRAPALDDHVARADLLRRQARDAAARARFGPDVPTSRMIRMLDLGKQAPDVLAPPPQPVAITPEDWAKLGRAATDLAGAFRQSVATLADMLGRALDDAWHALYAQGGVLDQMRGSALLDPPPADTARIDARWADDDPRARSLRAKAQRDAVRAQQGLDAARKNLPRRTRQG